MSSQSSSPPYPTATNTNPSTCTPTSHNLPISEAYDLWSTIYDHDSNPLQAIDDEEFPSLLAQFATHLSDLPTPHAIDVGCGTGRNTVKLLSRLTWRITGLEGSSAMLDIARRKCAERIKDMDARSEDHVKNVTFHHFDLQTGSLPSIVDRAEGIICTLVMEHFPLEPFFSLLRNFTNPGAVVLLTNMHPEMGAITGAGFKDPETGEKVLVQSYKHTIEATLDVARMYGFEIVGEVREADVTREVAGRFGPRMGKWVGKRIWFGMILRRRVELGEGEDALVAASKGDAA
ncbi:hypothetical protein MMC25_001337 [Agyrium rufum]|nr:hypothetical protein [Agyrium rufum]